jgi:xanthine dehydrogenase accessory factor
MTHNKDFDIGPSKQNESLFELALAWADEGRRVAIATVISTWGSSSRPVGSQLILDSNGAFEGSVSGGCIEPAVIAEALDVIKSGRPEITSFGVSNQQAWDVGMTCGGRIEILIESIDVKRPALEKMIDSERSNSPVCLVTDIETGGDMVVKPYDTEILNRVPAGLRDVIIDAVKREICVTCELNEKKYYIHGIYPNPRLIIVGAVDISRALAQIARLANYNVVIIDPRAAFATAERFAGMDLFVEWPDEALEVMTIDRRTAIVVLTHDPKIDDPALKAALRSKAFYIGALGSRKTHADRLKRLRMEEFTEEELVRIHGPVGLDIGARTHIEIAVAIMAEIIEQLRKG